MTEKQSDYHISFFKPTTPLAKKNRNLVLVLGSIWFVAIFGFHILLKLIETPTKEKTLTEFEAVWSSVQSGSASGEDKQLFAETLIAVTGKMYVKADDRILLDRALAEVITDLSGENAAQIQSDVSKLKEMYTGLTNLQDPDYIEMKNKIIDQTAPLLGLNKESLKAQLIPVELQNGGFDALSKEEKTSIPSTMSLYCTHNQSVLTDTIVFGFPFHYFYTAVFLLILFVGLCWIYCKLTDKINKEFKIADV